MNVGFLRNIPHTGSWESSIDEIARERGYKNRDVITVTKEGLGDLYETKLKTFFEVRNYSYTWLLSDVATGAFARGRGDQAGITSALRIYS